MTLSDGIAFGENDKVRKEKKASADQTLPTVAYKKAEVCDNYYEGGHNMLQGIVKEREAKIYSFHQKTIEIEKLPPVKPGCQRQTPPEQTIPLRFRPNDALMR